MDNNPAEALFIEPDYVGPGGPRVCSCGAGPGYPMTGYPTKGGARFTTAPSGSTGHPRYADRALVERSFGYQAVAPMTGEMPQFTYIGCAGSWRSGPSAIISGGDSLIRRLPSLPAAR